MTRFLFGSRWSGLFWIVCFGISMAIPQQTIAQPSNTESSKCGVCHIVYSNFTDSNNKACADCHLAENSAVYSTETSITDANEYCQTKSNSTGGGKMISFMFGVLGSTAFWVMYFVLGLMVTIPVLKAVSTEAFNYVTKNGERYDKYETNWYVFLTIVIFVTWPFFATIAAFLFAISKLLWPAFSAMLTKMYKTLPTIKFERPGKEAEPEDGSVQQ